MLKTALLGILTILIAMAMRQGKAEFSTFVSFTGSILIAWIAVQLLDGITGSLERLEKLISIDMEYIALLLKMIGVTYLSEFSSSICRDAGYSAVAGQIELVGKLSILTIGMPIVLALFELMVAMI
ncbi:MAG: stage III sporulation protein AD [Lachnospiraceae bacterium]|nr:stage III sporulation protein AD [Lachnospiraceae bacterium]MBP3570180.1 stage III sporulation protein AD [Lachnospiraceae bacterium]